MKKIILNLSALAVVAIAIVVLTIASCKKSETVVTPSVPGNEFLTTVIFQCIDTVAPFDTTCGLWRILPAWSAADTSEAILKFKKGGKYLCNVYILDESQTPVSSFASDTSFNINNINAKTNNVTAEIRQRQNYHLVCFDFSPAALSTDITWTRLDYDTNNPPLQVGLNDYFVIGTTPVSNGTTEVTLHHQPNVKNGTCGPGTDDFDVTYTTTVY